MRGFIPFPRVFAWKWRFRMPRVGTRLQRFRSLSLHHEDTPSQVLEYSSIFTNSCQFININSVVIVNQVPICRNLTMKQSSLTHPTYRLPQRDLTTRKRKKKHISGSLIFELNNKNPRPEEYPEFYRRWKYSCSIFIQPSTVLECDTRSF